MEHCKYCSEDCSSFIVLSRAANVNIALWNCRGDVNMIAYGDDDRTKFIYYEEGRLHVLSPCACKPKFCPECGRKLNREEIDINEHRNI